VASLWGLFAFGLYTVHDPRIVATRSVLREKLWAKTPIGGMARYENDGYYRDTREATGNPWFVCSLWLADYLSEKAGTEAEMAEALEILQRVAEQALPSGVLAEQVHPITGAPLSVSPLTWSHATFVASTQLILRRLGKMKRCRACGFDLLKRNRGDDWIHQLYAEACDSMHGICQVK